jgi:hypothetical protein
MTTEAAAAAYLSEHLAKWSEKGYAVFNPENRPLEDLPVIYGFNNGGSPGWFDAALVAEDGQYMGGHICSAPGYMPADLGILEGARPDRHEHFRAKYPSGYRMDFVGYNELPNHAGLNAALKKNSERQAANAREDAA